MSKIVWTPDDGWTDDGPEATVHVDERGRIHAQATREPGTCWCGRKARKGWTTCTRHYSSGRAAK